MVHEENQQPIEETPQQSSTSYEATRKLQDELDKEKQRADEYINRLKYLQAEFQNYQTKMRKEIEEASKHGAIRLFTRLLDVVDDLERAVESAGKTIENKPLVEGVNMVLRGLKDILRQEGVMSIEAMGKPFNPMYHEAVSQVESKEYEDNTVVEEIRRGYTFNNRVIRPSLVRVAKSEVATNNSEI